MSTEDLRARRWERLLIVGAVAGGIAGAIALGAVLQYGFTNLSKGGGERREPARLMETAEFDELYREIDEAVFGPDVRLTEHFSSDKPATIWARIEAEDPHGVTVEGLCPNDEVTIESISGHGWFAGTPGWQLAVSAVVGATTDMLQSIDVAKVLGGTVTKITDETGDRSGEEAQGRSKQRDGWGRDEDGDFAQNEGGIIVCFPRSRGPVYAYDEYHLEDGVRREGRLRKHVPDNLKKECFFPVRLGNKAELSRSANESGVLHILAWDNNYRDNSGDYHVKVRVERKDACQP